MSFLDETRYATENLINLAMHELNEIEALTKRLASHEQEARVFHQAFEASDLNENAMHGIADLAFRRAARAREQAEALLPVIERLKTEIETKETALQALSGAILQIAKQGLSVAHGSLDDTPNGRELATVPLKEVIWHGRSQAMHSEESDFRLPVTEMFNRLSVSMGEDFSLSAHPQRSRAMQIVKLLGWTNYENYQVDMIALGVS